LGKRLTLAYGRAYGDRFAETVRWFRNLPSMVKDYESKGDEERRRFVNSHTEDLLTRMNQQMVNALWDLKPEFFQRMARAIEAEKEAAKLNQELHPLHNAVLSLAGVPSVHRNEVVVPERGDFGGMYAENKLNYTVPQMCKLLEKRGLRPVGQSDESWQVRVRSVCKELGLSFLPAKTGRHLKRA
jgi:hypothetical protein